jgi:hypothetical protein
VERATTTILTQSVNNQSSQLMASCFSAQPKVSQFPVQSENPAQNEFNFILGDVTPPMGGRNVKMYVHANVSDAVKSACALTGSAAARPALLIYMECLVRERKMPSCFI